MSDKVKKVRTSITIDPEVWQAVKTLVDNKENGYKSVSQFIEQAVVSSVGLVEVEVVSLPDTQAEQVTVTADSVV